MTALPAHPIPSPSVNADKEALRRQAADAMKAVELRSLNLLEGGLGGRGKGPNVRGVPMAATAKHGSMGNMAAAAAAAAAAVGAVAPPGMAAAPASQQQQQHTGAPGAQQQHAAPGHPPGHPPLHPPLPPKQHQQQQQAAVQPLQPQANGVPVAAAATQAIPRPAVLAPPPSTSN